MADTMLIRFHAEGSEKATTAIVTKLEWEITEEIALESGGGLAYENGEHGFYTVATIPGTGRYSRYTYMEDWNTIMQSDDPYAESRGLI